MSNINKIVELQVEVDDLEFEDVGVEIMSLVEEPAIGVHWAAFAAQHLFVNKIPGESENDYMGRCLPKLVGEGYEQDQAYAICSAGFRAGDKVSFDYDDTLTTEAGMKLAMDEIQSGSTVYIISARSSVEGMINKANELGIPLSRVYATGSNKAKVAKVIELGITKHIDNNADVIAELGSVGQKFEINVDALPNYVDQIGDLKEEEAKFHAAILAKASEVGFGEVLDLEMTTYVNLQKEKFETISDFLKANDAIDILGEIANSGAEQMIESSYRYTGSLQANSRLFCASMIGLGKIYTRAEIAALSAIPWQPGMGPGGTNTYNIFDYKGGVNCQHYWEELAVFRSPGGRNIVLSMGPAAGDAGEVAMSSNNWWRMSAQAAEWKFAEDDDQMIITGPAMKAFQLIPRRDEMGNLFHVYFSDDTIKKLSEKFLRENKQHMTDVNHSMNPDEENSLIESWIVTDPEMDKSKALGFNPGKGDWYVSYKINNMDTWKQIKEGKLNGFSIAGQFIERISTK